MGYLTHKEAVVLIRSGDLLLNFVFRGADQDMISGKLLEYLASEVPVLSLGDPRSEAGKLLKKASFAQMIDANDTTAIKSFIKSALRQKNKLTNQMPNIEKWSKKTISLELSHILEGNATDL